MKKAALLYGLCGGMLTSRSASPNTVFCYVVTWEIIYFKLMPGFGEKYSAYTIEHLKASGASQQTIEASVKEMQGFKQMYDNPWMNAAITFTEPFPIGLVVALISAAVLRKK